MAKTIKFNLILDEQPVRNLESLKENFSIEDLLKYFENGLLLRWLKVRGYMEKAVLVEKIDKNLTKKEIVIELIKIFEIETNMDKIDQAVAILSYIETINKQNAYYRENATSKKEIIDNYHSGYISLIEHMIENKGNMSILKADAIEMENEYIGLFEYNARRMYERLLDEAPKAVFAVLTRDSLKKIWINNSLIYSSIIKDVIPFAESFLETDAKVVKRNTQAMWDAIEPKNNKVMVLQIAKGTFIKNAGEFSEKLGSEDVNEKFLVFNGLEYQCNNKSYRLLYMEV